MKTEEDYDVERTVQVNQLEGPFRAEERPKQECPNCRKHQYYKTFRYKTQPLYRMLLPFVEKIPEEKLGLQLISEYCDNCGYKEGDDTQ